MMGQCRSAVFTILLALVCLPAVGTRASNASAVDFINFESGQVRPLALSPDGTRLYAVNTPDNRLGWFDVTDDGIELRGEVEVGLEPVAVAARTHDEVWVVNHLSDSISIVDFSAADGPPRVVRTLLVGDEPRDLVFAGDERNRAFITTAHRGQHSPSRVDMEANEGRADLWVFDALAPSQAPTVLPLFGDTPRALAASPDGSTVYAAVFASGNRSTIISLESVDQRIGNPATNIDGVPAPTDQGVIVRQQADGRWLDAQGRDWSALVRIELPDYDVFVVDALAPTPAPMARISGVGSTLFNMTVTPDNRHLLVSNLAARNDVRFEGFGDFAPTTVRGHFIENRVSVIDLEGGDYAVAPRHLNKHIDYGRRFGTPEERATSLATPLEIAVTADGTTAYVAAFGSARLGVFEVSELVDDSFTPSPARQIALSGGGPSGVVLDEAHDRAYVLTRFDNSVKVVDLAQQEEVASVDLNSPEPVEIIAGRPFLYDARLTSSRGDSSCAGCHLFGDTDHLVWNLGNPDASVQENFNPFVGDPPPQTPTDFHPMKGPMGTQSLRGIADSGPMHWRGDRSGATGPDEGDFLDPVAAFQAFNGAFEDLLARATPLTPEELDLFTAFGLSISYPPNPERALDNSLTPSQAAGRDAYFNVQSDRSGTCNTCHVLDPVEGRFGTSGFSGIRRLDATRFIQPMKIPHLRNIYTKVGFLAVSLEPAVDDPQPPTGPVIRGFGLRHDGSDSTVVHFLRNFTLEDDEQRRQVQEFIMAYDSNLAPIVGQQVTLVPGGLNAALPRLSLLAQRAAVAEPRAECDLIFKGVIAGERRGGVREADGRFRTDRAGDGRLSLREVIGLSQQAANAITLTCVPPGAGQRMGIDRDRDGVLDGDESR